MELEELRKPSYVTGCSIPFSLANSQERLAEILENKKLRFIHFNENVNDVLAKIIAAMLRGHKKLQHLSFQGGREDSMGDNGILALAPVFSKCKLEILELQSNNLGNQGAISIAKALESNQSLTYLDLQGNKIGVEAGIEIGLALKCNESLQTLLLQNNSLMWDSASKIFQALKTNRSLQRLNLSGNRIVYEDEPDLDLSNNLSLTHLSLEGNTNLFAKTTALLRNLPKNLTTLSLKFCYIFNNISSPIAELLSNSCLTTFQMNANDTDLLIEIARALTNNQTLRRLYCPLMATWDADSLRSFINLLRENFTITEATINLPTDATHDYVCASLAPALTEVLDRNKNLQEKMRFKLTKVAAPQVDTNLIY